MKTANRFSVRNMLSLGICIGLILVTIFSFTARPAQGAKSSLPPPPQKTGFLSLNPSKGPVSIPLGKNSVNVDGSCDPSIEYLDAISAVFTDAYGVEGTIYLKHDGTNLYICMVGAVGTLRTRFASIYLDTDFGQEAFATEDDYSLRVNILDSATSSYKGTGVANGYTPAVITGWTAQASTANSDFAEYKIPLTLTGGWCGDHFGLAVYHHWLQSTGNDYGWPSNQYFDQPQTWQEVTLVNAPCQSGKIAYVYKNDSAVANDFKSLLEGEGFTVELIRLTEISKKDFSVYDLVIIAADTGSLNEWGTAIHQVDLVIAGGKGILGLGEGGYAFFGKLGKRIGWPNGWHGPLDRVLAADASLSYYLTPYDFTSLLPGPFQIYNEPVNEVGIYLPGQSPPGVLPIGWEPPANKALDHAPLIAEDCYQLWGFDGGPTTMNLDGKHLFTNAVVFGLTRQCAPPPPPQLDCLTLTKTAFPAVTENVAPGDIIKYTLTYSVTDNPACTARQATLVDTIPADTVFIPGSASDGIAPNIDHTLAWNLGDLAPGASGSKTFFVKVLDTQCHNQRRVNNISRLFSSLPVVESNLVSHNVNCPPVTFPNDQPPYAEEEVQVYPYPLIAGRSAEVSVRVRNLSAAPQTVTVSFQLSPDKFGIGLGYNTIPVPGNPRLVTLPPFGTAEVRINWSPVVPGHYCIQVKIEGNGFNPIYTQRNLDVAENLQPGVEDSITFAVGNPTAAVADVLLVVDNTCPGWTAWVDPATLAGMNPGEVRTATLHVIPPSGGRPLGTACHIDVQGWIGDQMIGGIRKLDVPAVRLPQTEPPWLEPEISLTPDPPVEGQPTNFCVELQNPLPVPREVTLTYSVADFGAGIPFTDVGSQTVTLPANSIAKYCINWTPIAGGTLHRCLRIKLHQAGFEDQYSQRNVNIVRHQPLPDPETVYTFTVGNTEAYTQTLEIRTELVGIRGLRVQFSPDPPPDVLGPDQMQTFSLRLVPELGGAYAPPNSSYSFGDVSRINISVYLNGERAGGITIEFKPPQLLFLPVLVRNE